MTNIQREKPKTLKVASRGKGLVLGCLASKGNIKEQPAGGGQGYSQRQQALHGAGARQAGR